MPKTSLSVLLAVGGCAAAPAADLVDQLPGFEKAPFNVYSGYLTVPGPFELSPYDELKIHYQARARPRARARPVLTRARARALRARLFARGRSHPPAFSPPRGGRSLSHARAAGPPPRRAAPSAAVPRELGSPSDGPS